MPILLRAELLHRGVVSTWLCQECRQSILLRQQANTSWENTAQLMLDSLILRHFRVTALLGLVQDGTWEAKICV